MSRAKSWARSFIELVLAGSIVACGIGLVYDKTAPIYTDAKVTDITMLPDEIIGTLSVTKRRDCSLIASSAVALAGVKGVDQYAVRLTRADGTDVRGRDFPPREDPYVLKDLHWKIEKNRPIDFIAVVVDVQCAIFRRSETLVTQRIPPEPS